MRKWLNDQEFMENRGTGLKRKWERERAAQPLGKHNLEGLAGLPEWPVKMRAVQSHFRSQELRLMQWGALCITLDAPAEACHKEMAGVLTGNERR